RWEPAASDWWRWRAPRRSWSRGSGDCEPKPKLSSPSLPFRLALRGERSRTFDRVLGAPHPLAFGVGEPERDIERVAEPLLGGLLARAYRQRCALEDLVGPLDCGRHQLGRWHDLVHHAQAMRLLRRHVTTGEDVAHGHLR